MSYRFPRTLLSILVYLNGVVVWIVTARLLISNFTQPSYQTFWIDPSASVEIGIINSTSLRIFHISVSWWFFTGGWVAASLLKSPGLVSGFWAFLAMLSFGQSLPIHRLPSPLPFNNPLVIVPNAPITIGTIVTFMFHSFFNSLARSRYLSFFSLVFSFTLWFAGTAKSTILQILFFFFLLIIMVFRPGLVIPLYVNVS